MGTINFTKNILCFEIFYFTLYFKELLKMSQDAVKSIEEIKSILHKNTRLLSLSGWSGIAAGVAALLAAVIADSRLSKYYFEWDARGYYDLSEYIHLRRDLALLGVSTLLIALALSTFFTWRKIRKDGDTLISKATRNVMTQMLIPLVTGGVFVLFLLQHGMLNLVAPCCLIFYGLALFTASRYTLGEIRYLGMICILLGLINLWMPYYSIVLWALGFGVAHILYGIVMLKKYD